jgi:hypothetical protein
MATFTASRAADKFPTVGIGYASQLVMLHGTISVALNPADGDIYKMFRIPAGFLAIGGQITAADIDTGTEAMDIDFGWAADGKTAVTFTDSAGVTWTSSGATADPDGFANLGVWSGDGVTDLIAAGQIYRPIVLGTPKWFAYETMAQLEANAAANAFTAGSVTAVLFGLVIGRP